MPDLLKITAVTEQESAGRIWEVLDTLGALAVTLENAEDGLDCEKLTLDPPHWQHQAVSGLFDDTVDQESIMAVIHQIAGPETPITMNQVPDRNWIRDSEKGFQPIQITRNLWICPVWHQPKNPDVETIWITPGLAFGTGKHVSTALCIEQLLTLNLNGMTVLDWGCGSGILAIVALKLGASTALGVDTDYRALAATRAHSIQNDLDDRLTICRPEEIQHNFRSQIIVANLLASTLLNLAPTLDHHLADNGKLIVSGILEDQTTDIISAFGAGYSFDTRTRDSWKMMLGAKKQKSIK